MFSFFYFTDSTIQFVTSCMSVVASYADALGAGSCVPFQQTSGQWTGHFGLLAVSLCFDMTPDRVWHLCLHMLMHCLGSFLLQDNIFLRLLVCNLYRDAGTSSLIWAVCKHGMLLLITDILYIIFRYQIYPCPVFIWRCPSFTSRKLFVSVGML